MDVDNRNMKPSYFLEVNSAQFLALLSTMLVYSSVYPGLFALAFVTVLLGHDAEVVSLAKLCSLRPRQDIYNDELLQVKLILL